MKLAITGKGGVGKTTIVAGLAYVLAQRGHKVLAIDADPATNLNMALGMPLGKTVGRIREETSHSSALGMWIVSENLRKGSAVNTVQIAEEMLKRNWLHTGG